MWNILMSFTFEFEYALRKSLLKRKWVFSQNRYFLVAWIIESLTVIVSIATVINSPLKQLPYEL